MSTPVSLTAGSSPTPVQRLFRLLGHAPLPKMQGLLWKLGILASPSPQHFEVQFAGLKYRGRLDQLIDRHIYYLGAYSPVELDFLRRIGEILRKHRGTLTFVDIGANVGLHSLFMARRADWIAAFEPNEQAADQFEANLRRNGLSTVTVHRHALGAEEGFGELGSGFDGNSGSRSLTWSLDASKNERVRVRHADRALAELAMARVDLIKIDVEGYEKNVLEGLAATLRRDRPAIMFELVGTDTKGGFRSAAELQGALYPDHCLFTLEGARKARLAAFDWAGEEAVCLPRELVESSEDLKRMTQ